MFFGRTRELSRIEQTLAAARLGTSGVLVLSGGPGIGKTTLLEQAIAEAEGDGMLVLRARGVHQEADVPFAGLLGLLRPLLGLLDALPEPQARALRVALALDAGRERDRFAIGAATLGLLATAAEGRPLLVALDDAQWLDEASLAAVAFAARRLLADAAAVLVATRPGTLDDGSLPTLRLTGLDRDASRALLEHRAGRPLPPDVADLTYERTAGNPLALAELAAVAPAVSDTVALPIETSVERAYAARVKALPDAPRRALALAAAEATGDMEALVAAAATLGLEPDALHAAADRGLVTLTDTITFVHPLAASAAYRCAAPAERRAAHRALAAAVADPDRRAWHLAAAATGPDEEVAAQLDAAGARARARSAYATAAAAHERAARLTGDDARRRTRLLAAADAAWLAGHGERADRLLAAVGAADDDPEVAHHRGHAALRAGRVAEAYDLFVAAAERDPDHAVALLADATNACAYAARPAAMLVAAVRTHDALGADPDPGERDVFLARLALGMASIYNGRGEEGAALVREAIEVLEGSEALHRDPRLLTSAALGPLWLRERSESRRLIARAIDAARAEGAVGALPFPLWLAARDAATSDRPAVARARYEEAIRLARETGQATALAAGLAGLACVQARQGDEHGAREHAGEALALTSRLGLDFFRLWALDALAELELGLGHSDAALARLREKERLLVARGIADPDVSPAPELVEALVHADRATEAERLLGPFERHADDKGQPWALARAARARGILDGDEAAFARALDLHARTPDRFEDARTSLCHGEMLRRARRRADARVHLRRALELFDDLGAAPWAERARGELEATGETARRRDPSTIDQLTPRELQVALVLADGATTREAAARLFLSPKTVDYHLRHVYRKLGISDRAALAAALAPAPAPAAAPGQSQEGVLMRADEPAGTVAP
ncbi:MAG TPA: AAA family ATPase [Baekduia sp.]|uniref:helix-turn-helix transcriptional regulator n=1 Tax=Baekduia sp. TaxID=2600305 RepID=UPI002D767A3C|nr:AAA family ATPase [Baekduia sp.]HET6507800.1 AAA family ATPase [Baekduia sp.]